MVKQEFEFGMNEVFSKINHNSILIDPRWTWYYDGRRDGDLSITIRLQSKYELSHEAALLYFTELMICEEIHRG